MLFILIVGGLIGAIVFFCHIMGYWDNIRWGMVAGTLLCLGALIFGIIGTVNLYKEENHSSVNHGTERLLALQDEPGVKGKFYAGYGTIESELYYFYIMDLGSYSKMGKIPANRTFIYETNDNFRVEWIKEEYHWLIFSDIPQDYTWRLYVPKGTIKTDYMIDLG